MKPFEANLKTLIQCPPLWFWHAWGLIFCLPMVLRPLNSAWAREGAPRAPNRPQSATSASAAPAHTLDLSLGELRTCIVLNPVT